MRKGKPTPTKEQATPTQQTPEGKPMVNNTVFWLKSIVLFETLMYQNIHLESWKQ